MLLSGLTKLENKIGADENILVVRQHNQIGDMLCSLTLYAALKKKYPNSKITLVAAKTNYEIPFFDINPFLDNVIVFDKQNLKTIFRFLMKLRRNKYQLGIVPSTIKLSRTSHIINYLSGAKIRVGVKSISGGINKSHKLLNIKSAFLWKGLHQLERNLDIVRQIGCDLTEEDKRALKFDFSEQDIKAADEFLDTNFPDKTRKIIGFHPGAGKILNTWDTEKFIELIKKLYTQHNNYILITSGWTDELVIKDVRKALDESNIMYSIVHNLSIKKLAAIISKINLYITNDTGAMHIAGFSDATVLSLFGPTDPSEWSPIGKNKYFIKSGTENINDITVDEVYNLSNKILEE